ncbi:MAG: hypothetical protein IPK59_19865 [Rhodospirillaceae bacterium]|nr:hypothetical protein [Rhodospirillaceae bacterium]
MTERAAPSVTASGSVDDAEHASGIAGAIAILFLGIFALLGVFVTARAVDGMFQLFGACLALFAILMLFRVIALLLPHNSSDI